MKILITGRPGIGKTTLCLKLYRLLKEKKEKEVCGIVSKEIREGKRRVGFEFIELGTDNRYLLAHVDLRSRYRIGKYYVSIENISKACRAIEKALSTCEVIIIDEIGPMELLSKEFIDTVKKAFDSGKVIVATIHYKARHKLIEELKNREDVKIFVVNEKNRDSLYKKILKLIK